MFFRSCTVDLLSTNSASEASMVKHVKFDHVLDTIFCWFWAESVQCAICTNIQYENHATIVPSNNHNKDVALLSYVEL